MTDDHDLPMKEYRRAGLEITRGNPEVYKSLWSRRDDATLANPFEPPVRGWQEVSDRLDLAASNYRDGREERVVPAQRVRAKLKLGPPVIARTARVEIWALRHPRFPQTSRATEIAVSPVRVRVWAIVERPAQSAVLYRASSDAR